MPNSFLNTLLNELWLPKPVWYAMSLMEYLRVLSNSTALSMRTWRTYSFGLI